MIGHFEHIAYRPGEAAMTIAYLAQYDPEWAIAAEEHRRAVTLIAENNLAMSPPVQSRRPFNFADNLVGATREDVLRVMGYRREKCERHA